MAEPVVQPKRKATAPKRGTVSTGWWRPYLMLSPAIVLLLAFTIYPMLAAGYMSFFKINLATKQQMVFNGIANYKDLLASPAFHTVMKNTVLFAFGTVPFSLGLAMFLAIQLNKQFKLSGIFRTLFFYPTVIPMMSAATIWLFMYTPQYGIINRFLGFFGIPDINFLGSSTWALPAIMMMTVWKDAGYFMLFYLAGLQNLPTELYEAAELDGANGWVQFRRLTFPLLMPTTLFVSTVSLINSFKTVDQLFLMTGGGPNNATNLLLFNLWELAFSFHDKGMAATLTVVLVVILLILAIIQNQWVDKKIHYN